MTFRQSYEKLQLSVTFNLPLLLPVVPSSLSDNLQTIYPPCLPSVKVSLTDIGTVTGWLRTVLPLRPVSELLSAAQNGGLMQPLCVCANVRDPPAAERKALLWWLCKSQCALFSLHSALQLLRALFRLNPIRMLASWPGFSVQRVVVMQLRPFWGSRRPTSKGQGEATTQSKSRRPRQRSLRLSCRVPRPSWG